MSEIKNYDLDEKLDWKYEFIIREKHYIAYVADGEAVEKYKSAQIRGSVFRSKTEEVQVGSIGAVENILVGYSVREKETNHRVGPDVVKSWPGPVVSELYDLIRENSGLIDEDDDEETVEDLKNQVQELQKRIDNQEKDVVGNSHADTMYGSDSQDT